LTAHLDNKALLNAFVQMEEQVHFMIQQSDLARKTDQLQNEEHDVRLNILFSTLQEQYHILFQHFLCHQQKHDIMQDGIREQCTLVMSFWSNAVENYARKLGLQDVRMKDLFSELQEKNLFYVQTAHESANWQDEASLWRTRCMSIAKLLNEKLIIDFPDEIGHEALAGSAFDQFYSAIERIDLNCNTRDGRHFPSINDHGRSIQSHEVSANTMYRKDKAQISRRDRFRAPKSGQISVPNNHDSPSVKMELPMSSRRLFHSQKKTHHGAVYSTSTNSVPRLSLSTTQQTQGSHSHLNRPCKCSVCACTDK